jgi:hypothetical protein
MRKVFISYRRDDADEAAGRLSDQLVSQFGQDNVFMDVDGIAPGRDFRKVIEETLTKCDVLLGVMGRNWLDIKDEHGNRRLENESDFVRLEIASALRRDIPVIPVRVQGASVPKPDSLPGDLQDFSYRNAVELTHERWNSDVQVLVEKLRRLFADLDRASGFQQTATTGTGPRSVAPGTGTGAGTGPAAMPGPINVGTGDGSLRNTNFVSGTGTGTVVPQKKLPTRRVVKWVLVGFFALCMLGALQFPGNETLVGTYFLLAAFFTWDPFKWFVVKH